MSPKLLTPREAAQIMRDIALGIRTMRRLSEKSWSEMHCGMMTVEVDGWVITFYNDCDTLAYCDSCYSPDGKAYIYDSKQRFGTHPVALLSTWELAQVEGLLNTL